LVAVSKGVDRAHHPGLVAAVDPTGGFEAARAGEVPHDAAGSTRIASRSV
jgi:hypothetical protein